MKKFLNRKYVFCLIIILFAIFPNTTRAFNFNWKMENFIEKKVIEGGGNTTLECSLNRSGKLAELKLSAEQLKQWKDTKLCSEVGTGYYFFTWQDPGSLLKTEEASINQKECEAKIATKKYPSATECYTTSRQVEIQEYNKSRDPDSMPVNAMKVTNFENDYTLLAPIDNLKGIIRDDIKNPNVECKINNLGQAHIGCYINILLMIAIGLCGGLAVIMIVVRGVQYMGDESVFGKTEAKHHIMAAILGLLLALGAYALLNTVNPDLLGGSLTVNQVDVELEGDSNAPIQGTNLLPAGIVCSGGISNIPNIAKSFNGKMTYSQDIPKGQAGPNNTIKLDCSGFVNYVLKCANTPFINSGTDIIFKDAEKVTDASKISSTKINGIDLKVGDLIGWRPLNDKKGNGHVMIYIGNGTVADSHSPKNLPGKAYGSFSVEKYKDRIKYIKRI